MKKLLHICLVVMLLVLTGTTATYAGFRVKSKEMATVSTMTTESSTTGHHKTFSERKLPRLFNAVKHAALPHAPEKGKTGWPGIVSLVCGVIGLYPLFWLPLGIAAIVCGVIGLNSKKHTNTGMAIAGLILGSIEVLLFILLVAIIAALVI